MTRIFLIGLMGAGKTTVGRQLAKRVGASFVDLDHEIEKRTGVRVTTIFELEGEEGFRERESRVLAETAVRDDIVVATGGGIVLRPENRDILRKAGTVIYLDAPPNILYERTRKDTNRPLLRVPDPLAKLHELHALRDPLYREVADIVIPSRGGGMGSLMRLIEKELARCAP